jgi:hypothetical protein
MPEARPTTAATARRPAEPVRKRRARAGAIVTLWTIGACALGLGGTSGCREAPPPPSPHRVEYRLTWARDEGVTPGGDGSWSVTNDLGYRVRVARGWITSYSMELVECPKESREEGSPFAFIYSMLLGARAAWAGHLSGTPNPAAIRPMQVESLTDPASHDVGAVVLAPQPYCQLHYLVARAGKDSPGLPTDLDMVDASLHLEGTYQARDADNATPFTVHTDVAYGQLFDHTAPTGATLHVDTGREAVRVEVGRRRSRMFDHVDFARMADRQLALRVLTSLVDDVAVATVPLP